MKKVGKVGGQTGGEGGKGGGGEGREKVMPEDAVIEKITRK